MNIHKPETCPCQVCGQQTIMLGTKLCEGCWGATANNHLGYVVINTTTGQRWNYKTLEAAMEGYHFNRISAKGHFSLVSVLKEDQHI